MTRKTFSLNISQYLKAPFQLSFLISSGISLFLLIAYFRLQPTVPLFYSLAEPNDFLVDKSYLIIFPIFSFLITIGHIFIIKALYHHEKIIPTLFAWCTVTIQVLLLLELIRIVYIIS